MQRVAQLEKERAFAFRPLNLLNAVAGAVGQAEAEDAAVASELSLLRDRLDWSTVDDKRSESSRFAPMAAAVFRSVT